MMEILNSMGGARATRPEYLDRPTIKVAPRGIVGERGGNQSKHTGKKARVESSISLPMIPKTNQRVRQAHSTTSDVMMSSRSEPKAHRTKPLNKRKSHGSLSQRSHSPDQRALDKQLLNTMMSKSQNDVSKLVSDSVDSMASLQRHAWTKPPAVDVNEPINADTHRDAVAAATKTASEDAKKQQQKRDVSRSDDQLPSIVDMTAEQNVRILPEAEGKVEKMKYIDLFHQLILWKKTGFLLDNLSFTQDLCDGLVEAGLFNADMMSDVMVG